MDDEMRISDFKLAATMLARNHEFLGANADDPRRIAFRFRSTKQLEEDIDLYWSKKLLIDPTDLWDKYKFVKDILIGFKRV